MESAPEFALLQQALVGHEVGHALAMPHLSICGDLMYDDNTSRAMSGYLPVPLTYSGDDFFYLRLR